LRPPRYTPFPYTTLFRSAGDADRDIGEAEPPRPPEGVGDDDGDVDVVPSAQRVANVMGGAIGVDGQQRGEAVVDVREIDAGGSRSEEHTSELQSLTNIVC